MVDKVMVWILLVVIGVTTIVVVALQAIHPMITAEIRLDCEQINFDLVKGQEESQPISLLSSGLWLSEAKISQFDQILFKAAPSVKTTELAPLCDGTEVVISPASSDSYVRLISSEEAFSLHDIFVESPARVSWGVHSAGQHIVVGNLEERSPDEISASFSTGDSLYLMLLNCSFLDSAGQTLYQTRHGVPDSIAFPVSFSRRRVNVVSNSGRLETDMMIQPEWFGENVEILRGLEVDNVDYQMREYSPAGQVRERNTVLGGVIKRPEYSLEDSVRIRPGHFIDAMPGTGYLESLTADSSALRVVIKTDVQSMKIGPDANAQHQLVKSMLARLWENQTLIIIYTVTMALFTFIMRFIVKRKKEAN